MRTYHLRSWRRSGLFSLTLGLTLAATGTAQQRRYLVELGAAGAYQSFDSETELGGSPGGVARLGLWLLHNFSVEVEGSFASPETEGTSPQSVNVRTVTGSLLYNIPIGTSSSFYLKAGGGSTRYGNGGSCSGPTICGNSGAFLGGAGFRVGLTPAIMVRAEGALNRNKSSSVSLTNFGANLGLSLMLGSKPIPDGDRDGILDNRDRCPGTPLGAQVDMRGCPSDSDSDGVPNGLDRCANSPAGAAVDGSGCPRDSDGDNIADGIDRCPDTPAGVLVDPRGCPRDADGDAIPDGLDRCSETPRGATVDALGCPGDEDGDGVLDGLDRCPRSPAGAAVNPTGCAPGQQPGRPGAPPAGAAAPAPQPTQPSRALAPAAQPPPTPQRTDTARARPGIVVGAVPPPPTEGVLPGVSFASGSARLLPESYQALDSVSRLLRANPSARVEISAHTDNVGSPADNLRLTVRQAEAVRDYLVIKGVPIDQIVARGYGATVPLTPDTTPRGRAANRRVEIRPATPGP